MKNGKSTTAAILGGSRAGTSYRMYRAIDLSAAGAFLEGTLLLEVDEEFDLELGFADETSLKVRARVTAVDRGKRPGMSVSFTRLGDRARKQLQSKLGTNDG
jgi:ethanolamine ammonia-lyase small subunit